MTEQTKFAPLEDICEPLLDELSNHLHERLYGMAEWTSEDRDKLISLLYTTLLAEMAKTKTQMRFPELFETYREPLRMS